MGKFLWKRWAGDGATRPRLVAALYETKPAVILNSGATGMLVGLYVAWHTKDAVLAALTLATVALTALLIPVVVLGKTAAMTSARRVRQLELWFGLTSCGITTGIGAMCSRAFGLDGHHAIDMLMTGLMLACIGTVLRNYFRPWIVTVQVVTIIGPTFITLLLRGEPIGIAFAFGTLAYAYNVLETADGLHRNAVRALINEDVIREQNKMFDGAVSNMVQGLCMFDAHERLMVANARYLEMFGFDEDFAVPGVTIEALLTRSVASGNHPGKTTEGLLAELRAQLSGRTEVSFDLTLGNGRVLATTYVPLLGGGWVATHEDITDKQAAELKIARLARRDDLTGVLNRREFNRALEQGLSDGTCPDVGVICVDLDRFKQVNDTLGHPAGDALLCAVASRLIEAAGSDNLVARLGGDEFAILQLGEAQPDGIAMLRERVLTLLGEPLVVDGHLLSTGASIGSATTQTSPERNGDELLKQADLALYQAKRQGRGQHRRYTPELGEKMRLRRQREGRLKQAFEQGEFHLLYQPLFDAQTLQLVSCEALLRWNDPNGVEILPGQFVPIAEETGLILPLGQWVIREALRTAACWPSDVAVAVNLSPLQLRPELLATITHALGEAGVDPRRLEVEVTEGLTIDELAPALDTLKKLRAMGVRIVMDDFGTGYSSLSSLQTLPFDKLKIDKSFVRSMEREPSDLAIVRAIIALADSVGMATTAEGVEKQAQLDLLQDIGCTQVQGYYLARPMPAEQLQRELQRDLRRVA